MNKHTYITPRTTICHVDVRATLLTGSTITEKAGNTPPEIDGDDAELGVRQYNYSYFNIWEQ